ncbi:MAG: hypothetical protein SynsKO_37140 [Synoicihabitans sp.]
MSTKQTLASGQSFHLFEEALDPSQNVWLDLDGCTFEATAQGIRVEIPLAIWEVIRQHTPACFDLAPLTQAQLRAEAETRVDTIRGGYRAALAEQSAERKAKGGKSRRKTVTQFSYREARLPREEHLAIVLAKLRTERASQRKLQRDIARLSA